MSRDDDDRWTTRTEVRIEWRPTWLTYVLLVGLILGLLGLLLFDPAALGR